MMNDGSPLNGIRVLDFSRVLAGPYCTMMLGDLGADVIKVERPVHGDETRAWGPPWGGSSQDPQSAYYLSLNRNKRSITLNLKAEAGVTIARRLAQRCHVVVENFKPGQMNRFGLGYEQLSHDHPALVYCSITGFGQTGPYRDRPGYDTIIQAMSGLMSITGPAEGDPYKVGVAVTDVFTALFACNAIQAALRHAEQTGRGQHIDMALLDSQLAALVNITGGVLVSGRDAVRHGNAHPNIVPYQRFDAADGSLMVAVGNDGQFARLCAALECPQLAQDPRYATNPARVEHRETLIAELERRFQREPVQHWLDVLHAEDVPVGPINSVKAVLNDPHVQARGDVQTMPLAEDAEYAYVASPMRLSETPPQVRRAPPRLGEHTDEVLAELLDIDGSTLVTLRDTGAI